MSITQITSLENEDLKLYSSLRNDDKYIVCDSEKVVLKLLKSNLEIVSILGDDNFYQRHPDFKKMYTCYLAERSLLTQIVGHKMHQCVMAIAHKPQWHSAMQLDPIICILNGVSSPENVGNIIRSLAAFNINSLIIDSKTVSPYIRRAIRVSMGNVFSMKISFTEDLLLTIQELKSSGYTIVGTANEDGAKNIAQYSFNTKTAFIIGSEGHGMEENIKANCHDIVFIPINDHVLHLNANNAASIFAYECSKQLNLV